MSGTVGSKFMSTSVRYTSVPSSSFRSDGRRLACQKACWPARSALWRKAKNGWNVRTVSRSAAIDVTLSTDQISCAPGRLRFGITRYS